MATYDPTNRQYVLDAQEQNFSLPADAPANSGISGNDLANMLTGDDTSNYIVGGNAGADTLVGGKGNDLYQLSQPDNVVVEQAGEGRDHIFAFFDVDLHNYANVEDVTITGSAIKATGTDDDNALYGNTQNNELYGGNGNDALDGGVGADTMVGGQGDDTYHVDSQSDVIVEQAGEGNDRVFSSITFSLVGTELEQLILSGTSPLDGTGNDAANLLIGSTGANHLDGGNGNDTLIGSTADTLIGGDGNDLFQVDTDEARVTIVELSGGGTDKVQASVSFSLADIANVEFLELSGPQAIDGTGNDLDNWIHGSAAANHLDGGNGNDTLVGSAADTLIGGSGDDLFMVDTDEAHVSITELAGGGIDTVQASVSFSLANIANVENLTLSIFAYGRIDGTGNDLDNQITGNQSANQLDGGNGNDTLTGGYADTLIGGDGDDTFVVDTIDRNLTITELASGGSDTVQASVSFSLANIANVENLTLTGTATVGNGNDLGNHIVGNDGNNLLDGKGGADILEGGNGNDIYIVDGSDTIRESANAGTDTVKITDVFQGASYNIEDNVENVIVETAKDFAVTGNTLDNTVTGASGANTLDGGDGNDRLSGWDGADHLIGGQGNDTLDGGDGADDLVGGQGDDLLRGGVGADVMAGGDGNDLYFVDNAGDMVNEDANGGTFDRVIATISYALPDNVEYLALDNASGNINGAGNALDNTIFGNDGNNLIDGGAGRDEIYGATGADTVHGGDGNDSIHESGSDNDMLFGDAGDDSLEGEGGNDTLDGGSGADHMTGGAGDDTYVVDSTLDVVTETGGGFDTVQASASFALSGDAEVEALIATGTGAVALTGNDRDNSVTGNEAANILSGQGGNDSLIGNAGDDTLSGDGGNDVLTGGDGSDLMQGGLGDDTLSGDTGNDQLYGGDGNDNGLGGIGNDTLKGENGLDNLKGDAGNDRLWGGLGKDTLTGGKGKDIFVFDTKPNTKTNLDKITDFNVKDDTIWLDNKVFAKLGKGSEAHPGKLNAQFFTVGNHAKDKNDYLIYDAKKGVLWYDADGSGSHKAVEIATLKKGLKMTFHDFFVI